MKRHPAIHAFAAVGLFATAVSIAIAPPPIPDLAYGGHGDGIARIAVAGVPADDAEVSHAVVQGDGGVVMIGTAFTDPAGESVNQLVLMRLNAQGLPDTAFGPQHDGFYRAADDGAGGDIAQTVDGKLVYSGSSAGAMVVGRLHADGTPDTGFSGSGQRRIAPSELMDDATQGGLGTVLPLPNGKMLALGYVRVQNAYFGCALRLLADGSTDPGFGSAGRTCVAPVVPLGNAFSLTTSGRVLADGRILLAGFSVHVGGSGWDMSVARLDAGGTLDTSFGPDHDGWAFVAFDQGGSMHDIAGAIAVDGEGRILLAGSCATADDASDIGIARLLSDGQLDASFGSQGRVQVAVDLGGSNSDSAHSIAALPNGDIVVGGVAYTADSSVSIAIFLKPGGAFDPRFGNIFFQADPAAPETAKVESTQQMLAGDYLTMVGSVGKAGDENRDFAATRSVIPLFADGFEDPVITRPATVKRAPASRRKGAGP